MTNATKEINQEQESQTQMQSSSLGDPKVSITKDQRSQERCRKSVGE
jgi:hypothetical protein